MIICPRCNRKILTEKDYCKKCGFPYTEELMDKKQLCIVCYDKS